METQHSDCALSFLFPAAARLDFDCSIQAMETEDCPVETRIALLPVEPWRVYVCWEIAPGELEKAKEQIGHTFQMSKAVLRLHDVTNTVDGGRPGPLDIPVRLEAGKYYIPGVTPNRTYLVEVGFTAHHRGFVSLARSNVARTPRAWPLGGERSLDTEAGLAPSLPVTAEASRQGSRDIAPAGPAGVDMTTISERAFVFGISSGQIASHDDKHDFFRS
jgi:hypothetical protein